jgi:hypothetical protein
MVERFQDVAFDQFFCLLCHAHEQGSSGNGAAILSFVLRDQLHAFTASFSFMDWSRW